MANEFESLGPDDNLHPFVEAIEKWLVTGEGAAALAEPDSENPLAHLPPQRRSEVVDAALGLLENDPAFKNKNTPDEGIAADEPRQSGVQQWITDREWDFIVPSQCRGCQELNTSLNFVQDLIDRQKSKTEPAPTGLLSPDHLLKATKAYLSYLEDNCPGVCEPTASPDDPYIKAEFDVYSLDGVNPSNRPDQPSCPMDTNLEQSLGIPPQDLPEV